MSSDFEPPYILVDVETDYRPEDSDPEGACFAFRYRARIKNRGTESITLLRRNWVVTDASGAERPVKGPMDIATHPLLAPGEIFEYTSGVVVDTPVSAMYGYYELVDAAGRMHEAAIPAFRLAKPGMVH